MFRGKPMSEACVVLMVATKCLFHSHPISRYILSQSWQFNNEERKKKHFLITIMWGENRNQ